MEIIRFSDVMIINEQGQRVSLAPKGILIGKRREIFAARAVRPEIKLYRTSSNDNFCRGLVYSEKMRQNLSRMVVVNGGSQDIETLHSPSAIGLFEKYEYPKQGTHE